MKRFLALLLIFILAFSSVACGNDEKGDGSGTLPDQNIVEEEDDKDQPDSDGEAVFDEKVNENADDINAADYDASEMEAAFDFGFSVSESFGMSGAVKKVDYSDLESLTSTMEKVLQSALSSTVGGSFEIFSEYDDEEYDDIGKQVLAGAIDDVDSDGKAAEAGVYYNITDKKYYQYVSLISDSYYSVKDTDIDSIIKMAKNAMGITLSKNRLTKAIDIAFDNATEKKDYYSLSQSKTINGDGYTETIRVSVDGFATEENEIGYYVYMDRERTYH